MTYSSLLACSIIFQLMVLMLFIIVLLLLIRHSSPNSFAVQRVLIFKTTFNKWLLFVSSTCLINKCQMQLQQVQILYHQCFSCCCYYYSILSLSATSVTKSEWKWKKGMYSVRSLPVGILLQQHAFPYPQWQTTQMKMREIFEQWLLFMLLFQFYAVLYWSMHSSHGNGTTSGSCWRWLSSGGRLVSWLVGWSIWKLSCCCSLLSMHNTLDQHMNVSMNAWMTGRPTDRIWSVTWIGFYLWASCN